MKTSSVLALLFLPSLLAAQSAFTIKGYGKAYKDGDSIFLSYRQNDQLLMDSTVVKSNSFEFKGNVNTIVKGYVCRKNNPRFAEILWDSYDVYIEPGTITLQSADSLKNSIASGTAANNDNAVLMALLAPVIQKQRSLRNIDYFTPEEKKDTALVNAAREKELQIFFEGINVRLDFIRQHPDSYVSLVNLANIARQSKFLPETEQCYNKLNASLKEMAQGQDIAHRIQEGKKVKIGTVSADFTQPDTKGKTVKLSDFKGKYILVDFWASWCLPCRMENPNVLAAYEKYKQKNFTVLSVSIDVLRDKDKWLKAVKEDKLPWIQVSDLKKENEAAKLYGITTIPSNVLIDPSGKVIAKDLKGKDLLEKLASLLG
ncbi:MAG: TlpA disulfide reductase family protein [Chitinophagaceae bacterium]